MPRFGGFGGVAVRIGSLFSGIGGLELGLERATGGRTIWQVEQNAHAQKVLVKHWPNARRHNDVRQVGSHNLEPVDIICGGFPCQDLSTAGKQRGIDGARSGLWSEYARIVRELRPKFVVVENVTALLSLGMGRILGDLATCGYHAIWDCISAQAIGAPHRRDRLFIVAWSLLDEDVANSGRIGHRLQEDINLRFGLVSRSRWPPEPQLGRMANGIPNRVDRLRELGNAVVPQVAEVVGQLVMEIKDDLA